MLLNKGVIFINNMHKNKAIKNISQRTVEFLEFRNKLSPEDTKLEAGIILEEIKAVKVDSAWSKIGSKINFKSKATKTISVITRVAAILTIPLLAFTLWTLFFYQRDEPKHCENAITWHEIKSPAGMRSHVVLPDGTDLWLNAESKIRYGIPFVRGNRQVELSGEAFLKVAKNENVPFVVKAGTASVKVLGTQFNLKVYPEDEQIEVALVEGGIEFTGTTKEGIKTSLLASNDFLSMNKRTGKVRLGKKNLNKHISWVQNIIIFDETPMPEVIKTLERWYGVKVVVTDPEINRYKFNSTFENESLFRVLELLELSSPSIKIKYTPGKINNKTNIATESTVIITKK